MPLKNGNSKEIISANIEELINSGYSKEQATAIAYSHARQSGKKTEDASSRQIDLNGWTEIAGNPISKVGVFDYLGAGMGPDFDPEKIYKVYRPEEELNNPETIESFRLLPWIIEHEMLGASDEGLLPAEQKGIHGITGENVYFEDGYLKANLKVYSEKMAELIKNGKKDLSIGYRCLYVPESGTYNGQSYDAVQRNIRGNHLSLVDEGRSGPDVAVLDQKFIKEEGQDMLKDESTNDEASMESIISMLKDLAGRMDRLEGQNNEQTNVADEENDDTSAGPNAAGSANLEQEDKDKKAVGEDDLEDDLEEEERVAGEAIRKEKEAKGLDMADIKRSVMKDLAARDALVKKLVPHIGVFDHAEKTHAEVAKYGVKKLGLICKDGHEGSALDGFLLAASRQGNIKMRESMDSNAGSSCVDAYLTGAQ